MMEQVRLCAVLSMENWLSFSLNQIEGWTRVQESYSRALEQGPLETALAFSSVCLAESQEHVGRSIGRAAAAAAAKKNDGGKSDEKDRKRATRRRRIDDATLLPDEAARNVGGRSTLHLIPTSRWSESDFLFRFEGVPTSN